MIWRCFCSFDFNLRKKGGCINKSLSSVYIMFHTLSTQTVTHCIKLTKHKINVFFLNSCPLIHPVQERSINCAKHLLDSCGTIFSVIKSLFANRNWSFYKPFFYLWTCPACTCRTNTKLEEA